ncbi:uncharacterized protein [Rutidosis leptorrhynchoides]|uniref:uncharacterized protein isoform X2 n=1 Tax=Rutidosis leptorrhynchoides TaxID=125765 RepID=UPI003A99A1F8
MRRNQRRRYALFQRQLLLDLVFFFGTRLGNNGLEIRHLTPVKISTTRCKNHFMFIFKEATCPSRTSQHEEPLVEDDDDEDDDESMFECTFYLFLIYNCCLIKVSYF